MQDNIISVLEQLKQDKDRDVRYFAGGPYEHCEKKTTNRLEDEHGEEEEVEETDRPIQFTGGVTTTSFQAVGFGWHTQ